MNSGSERDGGKIHAVTKTALLQRCEDASKNDQGWLVSDWRWVSGTFEVGLMDGQTDGRTDRHTDGRTDRPSYRDARSRGRI